MKVDLVFQWLDETFSFVELSKISAIGVTRENGKETDGGMLSIWSLILFGIGVRFVFGIEADRKDLKVRKNLN